MGDGRGWRIISNRWKASAVFTHLTLMAQVLSLLHSILSFFLLKQSRWLEWWLSFAHHRWHSGTGLHGMAVACVYHSALGLIASKTNSTSSNKNFPCHFMHYEDLLSSSVTSSSLFLRWSFPWACSHVGWNLKGFYVGDLLYIYTNVEGWITFPLPLHQKDVPHVISGTCEYAILNHKRKFSPYD